MSTQSFDHEPARHGTMSGPPSHLRRENSRSGECAAGGSQSTVPPSNWGFRAAAASERSSGYSLLPKEQTGTSIVRPPVARLASVSAILDQILVDEIPTWRRAMTTNGTSPTLTTNALPPVALDLQAPHSGTTRPAGVHLYVAPTMSRHHLAPLLPPAYRAAGTIQHRVRTHTEEATWSTLPASIPQTRDPVGDPELYRVSALPTASSDRMSKCGVYDRVATIGIITERHGVRAAEALSGHSGPSTAHSSYGQASETSPAMQYVVSFSGDQSRSPKSSSKGQDCNSVTSLKLTSGFVPLLVDIQDASRVADEKRLRNADASARFRRRRKAKQKDASHTISVLENEVKELSDGVGFYRRERDYLANVVLQVPGGDQHFPRPRSPPRRTSSDGQKRPVETIYGDANDQGQRSPESGRYVRRRTSTLSLPPVQPRTATLIQGVPYQAAGLRYRDAMSSAPRASVTTQQAELPPLFVRDAMQAPPRLPLIESQQAHQVHLSGPLQLMLSSP